MRLGLALSGGGLRATLFHLGVVRALQGRGVLEDVKHITSVSGGSILAAHLVKNWSSYVDPARFDAMKQEIIDFARIDVRGRIFRRLMLPQYYLLPYLEHLRRMPPHFRRDGTVRNLLFERYLTTLLGDGTLDELAAANPRAPQLNILTTNLTRGSLAYFTSHTFVPSDDESTQVPTRTTVARAVMASALFPAVFPTIELNADNLLVDPPHLFPQPEYFTDGGVYDNLGIRRFQTVLRGENCPVDNVLVCDASGAFDWLVGRETLGYWKTALRSTDILMKRLADLEYEIAREAPNRFTFVRISDVVEPAGADELPLHVQRQVKNVRTDLDRFTTTEIDTIVQHGYSVAARRLDQLYGPPQAAEQSRWTPFPNRNRPPEAKAIRLLQRARLHSTNLLRLNDWASYVYPVLLVVLLGVAWRWYGAGRFDRYYNTLPMSERGIAERLDEPAVALSEVEAAVGRPSARPETRLRVATLAYSIYLNGHAPRNLFDEAWRQLDEAQRARFEEARWTHYYGALHKDTFGKPAMKTIKDATSAVDFVTNAMPYVAPDLRFETALTSYAAFDSLKGKDDAKSKELAARSFELLKRAVDSFDDPDVEKSLNELNRFRARVLKGHYLREAARKKSSDKEAEELFRKAAQTYQEAGTIGALGDWWAVEFNTCNALDDAADTAQKIRDGRASATPEERNAVNQAIATTRQEALERCRKAQELAPAKNWQPSFVIGSILLKQQVLRPAVDAFLSGYRTAQKAGEGEQYIEYLAQDQKTFNPLCQFGDFSQTFVRNCRP